MEPLDKITNLLKALEAGSYDAAPSTLTQGSALQVEDLSPVMNNVTFEDKHLILQKGMSVKSSKSTTYQFLRQLSYGNLGGSAQLEGNVGQEETSDFIRVTVPMSYYSTIRRATLAANMVTTADGVSADERGAGDAAKKIAADFEFDLFRGLDDFSNAGVFDGNPGSTVPLPNIHGVGLQVRQSDFQLNSKDLMFAEYGSDDSVVVSAGGVAITQDKIEDISVRAAMNFSSADQFVTDPISLSAYNKIVFNKERIMLGGSSQDATGAELRKQWVSVGTVSMETSRFLSGKRQPSRPHPAGPGAPSIAGVASAGGAVPAGTYQYKVSSFNEKGESLASASISVVVAANEKVTLTITHSGSGTTSRGFNVYRSAAGGTAASAHFIGRVAITPNSGTTEFIDLGNRVPAFVTGYLLQKDTMEIRELAPYSRLKMAVTDLSTPEAHFRFACLAITQPRKNVILENIKGTL